MLKKITIMFVITTIICSAGLALPMILEKKALIITGHQVSSSNIEITVYCSGKIEKTSEKNINYDIPLLISDVYVKEGNKVRKGEALFKVDKAATIASLTADDDVMAVFKAMYPTEDMTADTLSIPETVTSPIEGTITELNITKGDFSSTNDCLVTVSNGSGLEIKANISESYISDVKIGQNIRIEGVGFEKTYTGYVKNISDAAKQVLIGTANQTAVETVFIINEIDEDLKSGYSVKISIITDEASDAIVVPYEVVQQDLDNNEYVYVIINDIAYKQIVTTGRECKEGFEITSGLSSGDLIVYNSESITKSGTKVNVSEEK